MLAGGDRSCVCAREACGGDIGCNDARPWWRRRASCCASTCALARARSASPLHDCRSVAIEFVAAVFARCFPTRSSLCRRTPCASIAMRMSTDPIAFCHTIDGRTHRSRSTTLHLDTVAFGHTIDDKGAHTVVGVMGTRLLLLLELVSPLRGQGRGRGHSGWGCRRWGCRRWWCSSAATLPQSKVFLCQHNQADAE